MLRFQRPTQDLLSILSDLALMAEFIVSGAEYKFALTYRLMEFHLDPEIAYCLTERP